MKRQRRIIAQIPDDLLARGQIVTGAGIAETVRKGLELLAAAEVYDDLLKMRGTVTYSANLMKLRADRR